MLISLILSAALQASAPIDVVRDFRVLCVDTAGDVRRVTTALAADGGWTEPARSGTLTVWSRTDDPKATLVAGPQQGRNACMLTAPGVTGLDTALAEAMGPHFGQVSDGGLYVFAPTAQAFERRDLTFIQVSSSDGDTLLTAIKPSR